jgi:hypothetical protein
VYEKLGFVVEYALTRFTGNGYAAEAAEDVKPYEESDFSDLVSFDTLAFGVERSALLKQLIADSPGLAFVARTGGEFTGFALGRPGVNQTQIGPVAAVDSRTAFRLVEAALSTMPGRPFVVDALDGNIDFTSELTALGFKPERRLVRMYLGNNGVSGRPENYFSVAGYEYG